MSLEDYKSLFDSIDECARCPICLDRVRSPVTLCNNGHGMCSVCRNGQQECPTCRAPFSKINPVFLNTMIEMLPAPCRNAVRGCSMLLTRSNMDRHELGCDYRLVRCRVSNCTWEDEITKLVEHVKTGHAAGSCSLLDSDSRCLSDFTFTEDEYTAILISVNDNLFWLFTTSNFYRKQIPIFFQCIKIKDNFQIVCTIKFINNNFTFSYEQHIDGVNSIEKIMTSPLAKQFMTTANSVTSLFVSSKYEIQYTYKIVIKE